MKTKKYLSFPNNSIEIPHNKIDHSITFVIILFVIVLFSSIQIFAQEKVENKKTKKANKTLIPNSTQAGNNKIEFKNSIGNAIITITDEGHDAGSITFPLSTPSTTTYKLYNEGGILKFNGSAIGSGGGADSINQLADAKYDGSSLFLGFNAGANDDGTSNYNTAVGKEALYSNITGYYNTANGYQALYSNTTSSFNTANGYRALFSNTSGNYNTANGYLTLYSNTTGHSNTANGYLALRYNTIGFDNTANGSYALYHNTTGINNTANGKTALSSNTTGNSNTANGYRALYSNTTGSNNIGIGYRANEFNQEGSNNTIIGFEAGRGSSNHNKSGNVFLGYRAGYHELNNNKLYINNDSSSSPLIYGDFTDGSELVKINGDFHVTGNITSDGTSGTVTAINDLADAKYQNQSLFLGDQSGALGSGSNNTSVGYASLNTGAGTENTSLGWKSMQNVTGANYSTAIGSQALLNESGNYNTAIGYKAIIAGTSTGKNNVAVGSNSLTGSATPISYNTAIGDFALNSNIVDANTAVGFSALTSNTTGVNNTAVGYNSQYNNVNGSQNTALGNHSGYNNIDGTDNVTIGYVANYWKNAGSRNTVIGSRAGSGDGPTLLNTSGNVFLGYKAGYYETGNNKLYIQNDSSTAPLIYGDFTDGSEKVKINGEFEVTGNITSQADMVAIGNNAVTSGSGSFAFGSNAQATANSAFAFGANTKAAGSYSTAIGFNAEANGDFSKAIGSYIRVNAIGSMFLADNSSSATVHTTTIDNIFNARFANGYKLFTSSSLSSGAQMLAGANSWSVISDSTKKENFKSVNSEDILNKISEFNLRSWNYKGQDPSKFRHYGPMAQEFYNAFGNDGIGTVGNDTTIASADFDGINLIAIQALAKRTNEQKELITKLTKQNELIKSANAELEERLAKLESLLDGKKFTKVRN